ncbi:hypothetical protein RhiirA1_476148 [Rhizophagus irregularis]|uniref:Uncharacterized protein n=1 Tax=Rhizophagus irregularis TaxID=588596 RepID=A0A2I1FFU5_9GLOM|nr:hypothetical protein RhiirA1_476148 [Rhizophagus irregularis]PKY33254.1 hypothetical protein RhiirB3_452013 [Rhizophagus irregularis]
MIDKEVIVNLGVVIQKGEELCLDGFFGLEIIPKSSDVEKFNFEGKLAFVKNERKVYAVALIISIIILPCNIKIELRTDLKIIEWLYNYSKMGSTRRELDDKLYVYLNFIDNMDAQSTIQDVKVPAIKRQLINCKDTIKETSINVDNILVDEYNLRWNYIPIEGAYRIVSEIQTEATQWNVSFKLINNEITTSKGVTSKEDAAIRSFRVKNFLKILLTYEILWTRKVWGIPNVKCPRCLIEEENVNEVVDKELVEIEKEDILSKFKERVLEETAIKSLMIQTENLLREDLMQGNNNLQSSDKISVACLSDILLEIRVAFPVISSAKFFANSSTLSRHEANT